MVDGRGDPNTAPAYAQAVQWLYSVSYALKFALKAEGRDYVVPPLERCGAPTTRPASSRGAG